VTNLQDVIKHLPGKHSQSSHAPKKGGGKIAPKVRGQFTRGNQQLLDSLWHRIAKNRNELSPYNQQRVVSDSVGLGETVIPKQGSFKGIPLSVEAFAGPDLSINFMGDLIGNVGSYTVTPYYKMSDRGGGMSVGVVSFNIPVSDIHG
jgi:hypothetical protein